jgi:hypothetical protein
MTLCPDSNELATTSVELSRTGPALMETKASTNEQEFIVKAFILASAATVLGACLLFAPASSQAAPVNASAIAQAGSAQAAPVIEVRNRRSRHWRSGRHWRGHYRGGHHYWRHNRWGYYHDDAGAALAAGAIFGLAAGAIAGSAAGGNAVAYCSQRFRSYDPASGTYLGYDGYRHPCP